MRRIIMVIAATAALLASGTASAHRHREPRHEMRHPTVYQDTEYPEMIHQPAHQQVFESEGADPAGTTSPGEQPTDKRCHDRNGQYEPPKGC